MVTVNERDCIFDNRINNALLYFTIAGYKETFILFTTKDKETFSFDNINEEEIRIAYIFKDDSNGGYAYLKPIKDIDVLKAATERAREFLYDENAPSRMGPKIMKAFKMLLGYDEE